MRTMIALAVALMATPAFAEDVPAPFTIVLNKGVICDTPEQVQVVLTKITRKVSFEASDTEGCGYIQTQTPALITPTEWYETPVVRTLLATFTMPNGWEQHGWIAFEMLSEPGQDA